MVKTYRPRTNWGKALALFRYGDKELMMFTFDDSATAAIRYKAALVAARNSGYDDIDIFRRRNRVIFLKKESKSE